MGKQAPLFTVFTPTYNRVWSLPRVFNCLKIQTLKDFEWVIIDDGSTDNTSEVVKEWQQQADFPIVYKWQPNQGKHIAYNTVAGVARGELFTNIDSDDEIIPEALEIMAKRWQQLTEEQKKFVSGIMFVSKDQYGNVIGDKFPEDGEICDLVELLLVRKIKGDKGGLLQTKVFKMYLFPESVKNVLVPEMVFVHQLSHDWKTMCINDALRVYWVDEREDHL
ncbi:MAG: glycosyltransferase family A protein, partial [Bacteroidota bacterium]